MIALFGASGYIGQSFSKYFTENDIPFRAISRRDCDYYCPRELNFLLQFLKPKFLINCAGYTGKPNVDTCEDNKAECLAANVYLPHAISQACNEAGVPWGHVASGCIYQGDNGGKGFKETDPPNFSFRHDNCSFYSGTKAMAEETMSADKNASWIGYQWRPRIPFNSVPGQRNYITKLLTYDTLLDVRNSLSHLDQFTKACYYCLENDVPYGTYNMTNGGGITTREITEMILERFTNRAIKKFKFFKDEEDFMQRAAKTPRSSCVLDNSKALAVGIPLDPVEEALAKALEAYP